MAPLGGVWEVWWTVRGLSHAIQEISDCLIILCLGGKGAPMNSTGELTTLGGRGGQITTLGEDLLSVGV